MNDIPQIFKKKDFDPYQGKVFKIATYQGDKILSSQEVNITSKEQLNTVLEDITQFNTAQEELLNSGYVKLVKRKRLITV